MIYYIMGTLNAGDEEKNSMQRKNCAAYSPYAVFVFHSPFAKNLIAFERLYTPHMNRRIPRWSTRRQHGVNDLLVPPEE